MADTTITITRAVTAELAQPLIVNLTVGGTASFPGDYTVSGATTFTATNASVTIPANQTSKTITLSSVSDTVFESDESVILTILPTPNVSSGNGSVTWTILNDDASMLSAVLLHFDGLDNSTTLLDSATPANTITAAGTAKISTTQSKFGGSSLVLNGTDSSYALVADNSNIELGNSDFTIEFQIYFLASGGYVLGKGDAATATGSALSWLLGSSYSFYSGGSSFHLNSTILPALNTWTHFALTRQGSTLRLFFNGINQNASQTGVVTTINNVSQGYQIGGYALSGINGFIDEFRIVKQCLYTADFTPPTASYIN
jgi:Concanavalin A-like lectin/glucanases superfamily